MYNQDGPSQECTSLRKRITRLSEASLRISSSLDLDTVLNEVVDSARALTGARFGCIAILDETGQPNIFVSSGLSREEHRRLEKCPDRSRLFQHFRDIQGAIRFSDAPSYLRAHGFPPERLPSGMRTLQGTPMSYQGQYMGNFFLGEKEEGEEFTSEDEEVLVLFASQAATAIANARTHRAEQRARADLEALVETSPVGVALFDAGTGRPKWFNQEARRIAERLLTPGSPLESLLEVMTFRRADGREIALEQLSLSQELNRAEMVRAEEIELSVPDGRSVTTLVNCTPIQAEDGAIRSVVVTMQDLAPLQEMERLRTEFHGMVSHELRAPLTSIKGSASTLLESAARLDPAERREFYRIILEQADHMRVLISDLLDAGRIDAGTLSVSTESSDVAPLVERARSTFQSGGGRHTVVLDLPPGLPPVMADRQRIEQVMNNLFSNAARHSPESSSIQVSAQRDGMHVAISFRDEGSGVAPERLPFIFQKYTGPEGSDRDSGIAGAGLGLAICKGLVEVHGGRIWAESAGIGHGTCLTFTVPVAEETPVVPREPDRPDAQSERDGRETTRVLVVDDDPQVLRYARDALSEAGYDAIVTGDHGELSEIIAAERPDLVLLDLMLPETDGIELMNSIPELSVVPVIFISAYGRDETIAKALDSGAADYIVKPFSPTELVARIRVALRGRADPETFVLGDLTIDYNQRRVSVAGDPIDLTATEYDLLRVLSTNEGRVSTFDTLKLQVWGARGYANPKLIRAFIKKLRDKLGDDARKPSYILNERGVGYRMAQPRETQSPS